MLLACQIYSDIRPMLAKQTDVFKKHAVTMSKTVNILKSLNKEGIYFSDEEIHDIQSQPFVANVARFTSSTFHIMASIEAGGIEMATELFFESLPSQYIDIDTKKWHWDTTARFIPIVIPEDYLNLYNFGFAESQSLPVLSQNTVGSISFDVTITGNGKRQVFKGRIAGFSGKINTILVPDEFLRWANEEYGANRNPRASRLLVEFSNASDKRIPAFIKDNGYDVKQGELESSKMMFFFRTATVFLLAIALIIIALSVAFLIISLNLIMYKNKTLFVNLHNIGYSPRQMALFYRLVVTLITAGDMVAATVMALLIRRVYVAMLSTVFEIRGETWPVVIAAAAVTAGLVVFYNIIVVRLIGRQLEPDK